MRLLRLMPDYGCWPIWSGGAGDCDNIDPEDLPIADGSRDRLQRWVDAFDAILDPGDPAASDFATAGDEVAHEREGRELWRILEAELAPDFRLHYHSVAFGRLYTHPDQLPPLEEILRRRAARRREDPP